MTNSIGTGFVCIENMVIEACSLGVNSCIVGRAEATFKIPEMQKLLKKWKLGEEYTPTILDRKYGHYNLNLQDCEITLSLDEDSQEDCTVALKTFENYQTRLSQFDEQLKNYAAENLLEDGNEWLEDEDKPPISQEKFVQMINLTGLIFCNDGTIEAFYDDGGIFADHCIVLNVDADGAITSADIEG